MKNISRLIIILLLSALYFPSNAQKKAESIFKILPSPQKFNLFGFSEISPKDLKTYSGEGNLTKVGTIVKGLTKSKNGIIQFKIDPKLNTRAEGYSLKIENKKVLISAKDQPGLLYAFMTLEQMVEDATEQMVNLPICEITDYPLLNERFIHLDIKHHREKIDYYYNLMDDLSKLKINGIIAELEDKIAYKKHPIIASEDAISIEDWIKLSDYANERNISISPLIQGLGHASFILKHEKYTHLRDDPENDWAFNPLDPEYYELQFDLYREAIKATPHGKYLHIGGDEVHTTGRNSGRSALDLQLLWLEKVCKFAAENNRIPIFWDDMPLQHAKVYRSMFNTSLSQSEVDEVWAQNEGELLKFLDRFPKNCIYMRWNYEKPQALGNTKAMEWFLSHGLQVMGATAGQTRWALMPQESSNMHNIRDFALTSINQNLNGLLLTLWDDDSPHFELYKRGIYAFAEYTWSGDKTTVEELKKTYRHRAFSSDLGNENYAFIDELEERVKFWENAFMQKGNRRSLKKEVDAKTNLILAMPDPKQPGKWSNDNVEKIEKAAVSLESCENIGETIALLKVKSIRNQYTLEVYEQVNELVKYAAKTLLTIEQYDRAIDKQNYQKDLMEIGRKFEQTRKKLEDVYGEQRILNKPSGYILDQDHHRHMANQSLNFDWQFKAEILMVEKVNDLLEKEKLVN
ncbi:Glycosyl hydrolase family 20, catalytic domain [Spirosomataceae bacterium TFI 002]|nr:Glycosyl hydrolase family 20, catalytic domain [Spirosomataceae bacterium TFI 002]